MSEAPGLPDAVVVVGPTAVGKTEVAVRLAGALDGEIVSLDSRQIYRGLDIGTAKPSRRQMRAMPHHLIDIADPDETVGLSEIQRRAYDAVASLVRAGRLPVLAGGTGQYVMAVTEGWQIPRVPPDPEFRAARMRDAHELGHAAVHARLAEVDPASAAAIDPRNLRRVIRALEVHHATGRPFSEQRGRTPPPFRFTWVGLTRPRPVLYARIDHRIADMVASGLEAEVRSLVDRGYGFGLPSMSSLGYIEWSDYLAGEIDAEEVVRRIARNTRRLVRSQGAWFRSNDPRITWFDLADRSASDVVAWTRDRISG